LEQENIYHRYLNLPFEISKHPLCETVPDSMQHIDIWPYKDEAMDKWLASIGLHCNHTEVFYTPPNGGELPIHADDLTIDNRAKINITWGPKEGTVRWWESANAKQITDLESAKEMLGEELQPDDDFSERQHTNLLAKKEDCTLVYECGTNTPSLLNVGQLHSTYNPTNEPRWTLCFVPGDHNVRGGRYLTFKEACEYMKEYIIGDDDGN
jgi:hypothetical protein|tara:strand:+ start:9063 stop:9692 length:630 start_codon:yes stop_codon:yes gene_type:complete